VPISKYERLLGDVIELRIGGVAGDAQYFLLDESRREKLGIPKAALVPVLSRARHLTASQVTREEWDRLKEDGQRVWLFRPPERILTHPAVKAYLELAEEDGGCRREAYKLARDPWYVTPLPEDVHGFISGMSGSGPWIALKDMRGLSATNTLYTVRFRDRLAMDERAAWSLSLLTEAARGRLAAIGRQYADGLIKYEPGDLARLPVPIPARTRGAARTYRLAIAHLVAGEHTRAQKLADQWLLAKGASA